MIFPKTTIKQTVALLYCLFSLPHPTTSQLNNAATLELNSNEVGIFINRLDRAGISPGTATTILAPSNDAYTKFNDDSNGLWQRYTSQVEYFIHFRDLHLWHLIVENQGYTIDDIFNGNKLNLENQIGNITVNQQSQSLDGVSFLNDQNIVQSNIVTSQGYLHIIDQIIVPPHLGMDMISNLLDDRHWDFAFTTMANIALWAELEDELNMMYEHGLTFLCPPNRRFRRAQIDVPMLLTERMREYTIQFVKSHMIPHIYTEAGIFASNEENNVQQFVETTLAGTNIWITTTGDTDTVPQPDQQGQRVRFQSEEVLLFDQATDHS